MRTFVVVEQGLRTPTGPLAGKFFTRIIRGSGAKSSCTPPLIRRTALIDLPSRMSSRARFFWSGRIFWGRPKAFGRWFPGLANDNTGCAVQGEAA